VLRPDTLFHHMEWQGELVGAVCYMEKVLRSISVIPRGTMRCLRMCSAFEQCQLAAWHNPTAQLDH